MTRPSDSDNKGRVNTPQRTIIERSTPADHFTVIPNRLVRDTRLSRFTRSCLIEILSNDADWRNTADDMWRRSRAAGKRRGEGRDAYYRSFSEMEAAGYLTRSRMQDPDGTWYTLLHFRAVPVDVAAPIPGSPVVGANSSDSASSQVAPTTGSPVVGKPVVGEPVVLREVPQRSNSLEEQEDQNLGSTPLSPRSVPDSGPTQTAAHSQASAPDDDSKIRTVAQAVMNVYQDGIEDEDALRIWEHFIGEALARGKKIPYPIGYLAKIMNDAPNIDSLLSNTPYLDDEIQCPGCGGPLMDQPLTPSGLCVYCDRQRIVNGEDAPMEPWTCPRCHHEEKYGKPNAQGLCIWCESELTHKTGIPA